MSNPLTTLTAVLRDIRIHCKSCMGGSGNAASQCSTVTCGLHKYATAPVQVDMFDGVARETWIREAVALTVATCSRGAWWSDIRARVEDVLRGPAHSSWWGGVASGLKAEGWRMGDAHRASGRASRNAAHERWWGPV